MRGRVTARAPHIDKSEHEIKGALREERRNLTHYGGGRRQRGGLGGLDGGGRGGSDCLQQRW